MERKNHIEWNVTPIKRKGLDMGPVEESGIQETAVRPSNPFRTLIVYEDNPQSN